MVMQNCVTDFHLLIIYNMPKQKSTQMGLDIEKNEVALILKLLIYG